MSAPPEWIVCRVCGKPIDPAGAWQPDMEGGGAHVACLETETEREEE